MGKTGNGNFLVDDGKGFQKSEVMEDPKLAPEAQRKIISTTRTVQVHVVLLIMQLGYAGHQVLSRVALTSGLSQFVYSIYRNGIALMLMGPIAFVLERKDRPPITWKLLFRFFLLGLVGIVGAQQLFLVGLIYTSATFAATMQNATPMFTFLLALVVGMEKVRIRRLDGKAKVIGTVVCISGAVLMSVWTGPAVIEGWYEKEREENDLEVKAILGQRLGSHALRLGIDVYRLGSICLLVNCISWAAYYIMLGHTLQVCPTPLTVTALMYFFGIIQVGFLMLVSTGGNISWSVSWGPQLFSVLYAGVVSSGINLFIQSWAIQRGGPLLVSLYTPVQSIIVAILSVVFLGDSWYLGSIIGGIGTVAGLYMVTWGQVEHRKQDALGDAGVYGDVESVLDDTQLPYSPSASSDLTHPLFAGGKYCDSKEEEEQSGDQEGARFLAIPTMKRRPSFIDDEYGGAFSPQHIQ